MTEEETNLIGKKVKILLKNGYSYTAEVKGVTSESLEILDRFGFHIFLNRSEIVVLQVLEVRAES